MKKTLGRIAAGSALVLTGLVAGAPAVSAETVDDYADVPFTIDVGGGVFYGGDPVPVTVATNDGSTACNWSLKLDIAGGGTAASSTPAPTFSVKLASPVVKTETPTSVTVTCVPQLTSAPAAAGVAKATTASYTVALPSVVYQTTTRSAKVTLLPRGGATGGKDDGNGLLPNTGGAALWILVAGGALVAGGTAVTVAARRRSH